jgi:putative nucleotidyltransferase with HDIG domain
MGAIDPAAEESELWMRQPDYDQTHAFYTARNFARRDAGTSLEGENLWLAAALLHDIGKSAANLTPRERIIAAPLGKLVKRTTARLWASRASGSLRRLGLFLTHGDVGARMIRETGGREIVAEWCELHQGDWLPDGCAIPKHVARMLIQSEY